MFLSQEVTMSYVKQQDPKVQEMIELELGRQRNKLEMIASENFVSQAVMEAQGSVLTNKYAEGYPHKRYYGGCEYVDMVEELAIERAKQLFGAEHVNVQPHSGSQANFGVYFALLEPGDTIMGMNLSHGGHLTHGSPVNVSGKYFNIIPYGVDAETGRIDYEEMRKIAQEHKPKMIIGGGSAYSRQIDFKTMADIAHEVGAIFMVDMAHFAGLVAAGLHPNPVAFGEALQPEFKEYAKQIIVNAQTLADALQEEGFTIVSGGTDTHVLLVDLRTVGLTGKVAEHVLDEVGITCNKNTIPFDPESPFVTSGIRLGTPALTTRGLHAEDMKEIASIISLVLKQPEDTAVLAEAKQRVATLCEKYPMYA